MSDKACISAIIVTYESAETISSCVQSLQQTCSELLIECIIVDNASSDDTVALISKKYSNLKLVSLKNNLGFGKANNLAAKMCIGDYLLLVNPDTILKEHAVQRLLTFIQSRLTVSACGPKIQDADEMFRYDSRRGFPTPLNSLGRFSGLDKLFPKSKIGSYWNRNLDQDKEAMTDALSGACILIRKDKFLEVGGFDEDYFLFGEDIDLCWKLWKTGSEIWYIPKAEIVHHKSKSMRKNRFTAEREFYRSMQTYIDKRLSQEYSSLTVFLLKSLVSFKQILGQLFSSQRKFI